MIDYSKNVGQLLLAIFLMLFGLRLAVGLNFNFFDAVVGTLAVVAGIFLVLGR